MRATKSQAAARARRGLGQLGQRGGASRLEYLTRRAGVVPGRPGHQRGLLARQLAGTGRGPSSGRSAMTLPASTERRASVIEVPDARASSSAARRAEVREAMRVAVIELIAANARSAEPKSLAGPAGRLAPRAPLRRWKRRHQRRGTAQWRSGTSVIPPFPPFLTRSNVCSILRELSDGNRAVRASRPPAARAAAALPPATGAAEKAGRLSCIPVSGARRRGRYQPPAAAPGAGAGPLLGPGPGRSSGRGA